MRFSYALAGVSALAVIGLVVVTLVRPSEEAIVALFLLAAGAGFGAFFAEAYR